MLMGVRASRNSVNQNRAQIFPDRREGARTNTDDARPLAARTFITRKVRPEIRHFDPAPVDVDADAGLYQRAARVRSVVTPLVASD